LWESNPNPRDEINEQGQPSARLPDGSSQAATAAGPNDRASLKSHELRLMVGSVCRANLLLKTRVYVIGKKSKKILDAYLAFFPLKAEVHFFVFPGAYTQQTSKFSTCLGQFSKFSTNSAPPAFSTPNSAPPAPIGYRRCSWLDFFGDDQGGRGHHPSAGTGMREGECSSPVKMRPS